MSVPHHPEKKLVVIGGINVDFVANVPHFPHPGESVVGSDYFRAFGGKGANQAVAAARLGDFQVAMVGAVGDDDVGRQALSNLENEQIDCQWVQTISQSHTGVALIFVNDQGENCISVVVGANGILDLNWIAKVDSTDWFSDSIFLASLESPNSVVTELFKKARDAGSTTILNPAPANKESLDCGLFELTDIVTPNEGELAYLTGTNTEEISDSEQSLLQATQELKKFGPKTVIVTLGSKGCFVNDLEQFWVPSIPVDAVDSTAAGDTFNGALACGLIEGKSLREAIEFANLAAAKSVTKIGAQPSLPQRSEL